MKKEHRFYVGGEWRTSREKLSIAFPYTGKEFAYAYLASRNDVEDAIRAAQCSFLQTRELPSHARAAVCKHVAHRIQEKREELAKIITLETGKALVHSFSEVDRAASTFTLAAEEASRVGGEVLPLDISKVAEKKIGITKRFPVGPISAITPFNFPLNLVAHKLAPAIASGNPIVLKPASKTPLSALKLAGFIAETEWPKGALSVLPCTPHVAKPLVEDERFKLVTFTGSASVGWDIKNRAGKKKVVLELGGNAAVIVAEDADVDLAAKKCRIGAFYYCGQSCIAVQRMYAQEKVFSLFVKKYISEVRTLKVGNPLHPKTELGVIVDEENKRRVKEWLQEALFAGAKILCGGKEVNGQLQPTLLTNVPTRCFVACREMFGPVKIIEKYKTFDDALRMVNDSVYGLQAGVFTNRMDYILKAFKELEVGGVMVNEVPTFRVDHMPYGGVKDSGFGREGLRYSIRDMTEEKLLVLNLP